jgi:hypothetical protein
MILVSLMLSASLAMPISIDRAHSAQDEGGMAERLTVAQKRAAARSLISSANECIARAVRTDPRFTELAHAGEVNELIVESVPSCIDAVRSMIEGHDRLFGQGSGESFFTGPYLDALPEAVNGIVRRSY